MNIEACKHFRGWYNSPRAGKRVKCAYLQDVIGPPMLLRESDCEHCEGAESSERMRRLKERQRGIAKRMMRRKLVTGDCRDYGEVLADYRLLAGDQAAKDALVEAVEHGLSTEVAEGAAEKCWPEERR